jgi:16S rRNA (guanine527-N7)-methyltransferase
MNETDARRWIGDRYGEASLRALDVFVRLVVAENDRQNLIARSTIDDIWVRHIIDSAQLVPLADGHGTWIDIGSGAGFPGIVVAILRPEATILVEPRRQRAEFLDQCVRELSLPFAEVRHSKIENVRTEAAIISARAVAAVETLLGAASACATRQTRWLLPRGRFGSDELKHLQRRWRGVFHVKQSLTDITSTILVCDGPIPR